MPAKYSLCPKDVTDIGKYLMGVNHKELSAIGVRVDYLFAFAPENEEGEKCGPALKLHGYPCAGIVRIVGLKQRVLGLGDAEIVLDGDRWDELDDEKKRAIIDHELTHLKIKRNVDGEVIYDTHGRPKLTLKLHDYNIGFFTEIAARYGPNSLEVQSAEIMFREAQQAIFPFAKTMLQSKKPKSEPKLEAPNEPDAN